jgi:catechol 2,3-dioxygenase-like lactoylglutathione lyase family enzyme
MDSELHFITLSTRDLDAARGFYVEGLGWKPLMDVPGEIVFFQVAPGLTIGFFDSGKFAEDQNRPGEISGVSGVTLSHNVGSREAVDATVEKLSAVGVTIVKPPQEGAFGGIYHAHVSDPNGIIWEIAHNPGWRIDGDGKVVFG